MTQPSRRDGRTHAYAVADVIRDLIADEHPPVGDKNRWLAERTTPSKDSWNRVFNHARVLDYGDLVEAAEALHTTAAEISRLAEQRVAGTVGDDRDHSGEAAPTASDERLRDDYDLVAKNDVVEVDPHDSDV